MPQTRAALLAPELLMGEAAIPAAGAVAGGLLTQAAMEEAARRNIPFTAPMIPSPELATQVGAWLGGKMLMTPTEREYEPRGFPETREEPKPLITPARLEEYEREGFTPRFEEAGVGQLPPFMGEEPEARGKEALVGEKLIPPVLPEMKMLKAAKPFPFKLQPIHDPKIINTMIDKVNLIRSQENHKRVGMVLAGLAHNVPASEIAEEAEFPRGIVDSIGRHFVSEVIAKEVPPIGLPEPRVDLNKQELAFVVKGILDDLGPKIEKRSTDAILNPRNIEIAQEAINARARHPRSWFTARQEFFDRVGWEESPRHIEVFNYAIKAYGNLKREGLPVISDKTREFKGLKFKRGELKEPIALPKGEEALLVPVMPGQRVRASKKLFVQQSEGKLKIWALEAEPTIGTKDFGDVEPYVDTNALTLERIYPRRKQFTTVERLTNELPAGIRPFRNAGYFPSFTVETKTKETLDGNSYFFKYLFKPTPDYSGRRDIKAESLPKREYQTYNIYENIGKLDIVPVVTIRNFHNVNGSAMHWKHQTRMAFQDFHNARTMGEIIPHVTEDLYTAGLLDYVFMNSDGHVKNFLFQKVGNVYKFWQIDNGLNFDIESGKVVSGKLELIDYYNVNGKRIPKQSLAKLRKLKRNWKKVEGALEDIRAFDSDDMDEMQVRLDNVLSRRDLELKYSNAMSWGANKLRLKK